MNAKFSVPRTCMELTPDDVGEAKIRPMEDFRTVRLRMCCSGTPAWARRPHFRRNAAHTRTKLSVMTARQFLRVVPRGPS